MCPVHQTVNLRGGSFEDRLDPPIAQVAHPSADPVPDRHASAGVAEEDALNLTGDQHPLSDHQPTVRQLGPGTTPPPRVPRPARGAKAPGG
jgi:hypothetical protein